MSDTPRTDEAIAKSNGQWSYELRDLCCQLERELTEAREQRDSQKNELRDARLIWAKYEDRYFETREQRDKLAEALEMVRDADEDCHKDGLPTIPPVARHKIDQALGVVAVKDQHKFCRTTSHCGCRYDSEKP